MTPFSSREENCDIVCCCVRDSIALFKRLLRFWATFWNDTILARSKSASLLLWFIRICQKLCCSYRYYYTCINMFKKTQTTDVLAAGSVFTSSKCCCISKRYQYTVCLVLLCKIAENSFTVLEEKIFIEEYFHVCMNVQWSVAWLDYFEWYFCVPLYFTQPNWALNLYAYVNFNDL